MDVVTGLITQPFVVVIAFVTVLYLTGHIYKHAGHIRVKYERGYPNEIYH